MSTEAQRIDNNQLRQLTGIVGSLAESFVNNEQNVSSTDPIRPISFDENIYQKAYMDSPFLDFLREKKRIKPTDSDNNAYPVEDISAENRAKRGNEKASDITGTDEEWTAPVYTTATFGKKISVTDKAQKGTPNKDLLGMARANAFIDTASAIDEALFNAVGGDNQFDGIFNTTKNKFNKSGGQITMDDVDKLLLKTMDYGAKPDGILATAEVVRQLKNDDDNDIIFNSNNVTLGKWASYFETPNGPVPLIIDSNINARTGAPSSNSHALAVIDSWSVGGDVLMEASVSPLARTDLSTSELIATFMSFCNINPERNGAIVGIGAQVNVDTPTISSVPVSVLDIADDSAISGAELELEYPGTNKTCTTGGAGGCNITNIIPGTYDINIVADGYENFSETRTISNSSTQTFKMTAVETGD